MQWTERRGTSSRNTSLYSPVRSRWPLRRSLAAGMVSSILTVMIFAPAAQAEDRFGNTISYRPGHEACVGPENALLWSSPWSCSYPPGYSKLDSHSLNGRYRSTFQADGNWVIYDGSRVIWSSGTAGRGATNIKFQEDGNIVIYRNAVALWSAKGRHSCADLEHKILTMQDDGNLVLTVDTPGDFTSPHSYQVQWTSRGGATTCS